MIDFIENGYSESISITINLFILTDYDFICLLTI